MKICAFVLLNLIVAGTPAAAIDFPYPGDDWQLFKPGAGDERVAKDYSDCLLSPMAPPIIDAKTMKPLKDYQTVMTHRRYVLACMGLKGYWLRPPKAVRRP